jgi:hypothetical protein
MESTCLRTYEQYGLLGGTSITPSTAVSYSVIAFVYHPSLQSPIEFVIEYLQRFDVVHRRIWDANEEYSEVEEALEGASKPYMLSSMLRDVAHKYVL